MRQPIHLAPSALRRRIGPPIEPPLPSLGDLIGRWAEEQARYRP